MYSMSGLLLEDSLCTGLSVWLRELTCLASAQNSSTRFLALWRVRSQMSCLVSPRPRPAAEATLQQAGPGKPGRPRTPFDKIQAARPATRRRSHQQPCRWPARRGSSQTRCAGPAAATQVIQVTPRCRTPDGSSKIQRRSAAAPGVGPPTRIPVEDHVEKPIPGHRKSEKRRHAITPGMNTRHQHIRAQLGPASPVP